MEWTCEQIERMGFLTAKKGNVVFDEAMEEVYAQEESRIASIAPRCHSRPMSLEECEGEAWWECSVCNHTKEIK